MGDIVYSEAPETFVQVMTAEEAEETFQPDDGIHGTHALFIGGDLGLVVEGTTAELLALAQRIRATVQAAADAAHLPACTGTDDLCGAPAGAPCLPGCPSLASDDDNDDSREG